jgi:branched-chain amino acid transport system permease protein
MSSRGASAVTPAISSMMIYLVMAVVLVVRPQGLFPVSNK